MLNYIVIEHHLVCLLLIIVIELITIISIFISNLTLLNYIVIEHHLVCLSLTKQC